MDPGSTVDPADIDAMVRVVYEASDGIRYNVPGGPFDTSGSSVSQFKGKLNDDTKFVPQASGDYKVRLCSSEASEICDNTGLDKSQIRVEVELSSERAGQTLSAGLISTTPTLL